MTAPELSMLWESTDAETALAQRFRFDTAEIAAHWLTDRMSRGYGVAVTSVDRLVISARSLLAWMSAPDGPLIAKCSVVPGAHRRLAAIGDLLVRLREQGLPVAARLTDRTGAAQVGWEHLSLGVQRVVRGELLDPADHRQAHVAGATLARLHQALAEYPRVAELDSGTARSTPMSDFDEYLRSAPADDDPPPVAAAIRTLLDRADGLDELGAERQLVHGDFRASNILWDNDGVSAVLDFEEMGRRHRVEDLAQASVLLGTRYHNWAPISAEIRSAFLAGYQELQPLTQHEWDWFPLMMLRHGIGMARGGDLRWLEGLS
ncbi:MAG TPA: phosphotransferase [Mycobacteriales bacterium]|nr:phosphotransferase [Mycobacteriales bacterium]